MGFEPVRVHDQSHRMAALAEHYLQRVEEELRQELLDAMGSEEYSALIDWTRIRARGLVESGSGYAHFHASVARPIDGDN